MNSWLFFRPCQLPRLSLPPLWHSYGRFFTALARILLVVVCGVNSHLSAQTPDSVVHKKKGSLGIYPVIGYAPETKVKMGGIIMYVMPAKSQGNYNRPNSIVPYIIYTGNKQLISSLKTDFYFKGDAYWNNELRYSDYPDFYYGVGTHTDKKDEEVYSDVFFRDKGRILKIRGDKLFYGLAYEFRHDRLSDFDLIGRLRYDTTVDRRGGWNNGLGPMVVFDTRDDVYYPSKGNMLTASSLWYGKALGSDYSYGAVTVDVRHFRTVWNERHVLALQAYVNAVFAGEVPFYRLPQLGGEDRLRGIAHENLYRDRAAWYLQAEGRKELFWRLSGVLFAGLGNVSPSLIDRPFQKAKVVAGFGGRFRAVKDQKLNLRLDVGVASDRHYAVYISLGEAF